MECGTRREAKTEEALVAHARVGDEVGDSAASAEKKQAGKQGGLARARFGPLHTKENSSQDVP